MIEEIQLGIDSTEGQQELDEAKGVEGWQGYDPRRKTPDRRPDPKPTPPPVTAESLLWAWYWHRTEGRIKSVGLRFEAQGEAEGQDEGLLAAMYVESTPGYSERIMRPVLMHKLAGKPWAWWYGIPGEDGVPTEASKPLAAARYEGFLRSLAHRLESEPFVVYRTKVSSPDHLEDVDRANDELKKLPKG